MKTAELTALGITEEVATQILAINGKDIENAKATVTAAKDKEIAALTTERDGLQSQLDTATTKHGWAPDEGRYLGKRDISPWVLAWRPLPKPYTP